MWQEQRQCSNSWTWARCSLVAIISPVMQGLFKTVNGMLSLHSGSFWSLLPQLRNKGTEENTNVEPDTCSPFVAWAAWCSSLRALAACILRKKCICKYPQIILQTSAEVAFCFQTPPLCLLMCCSLSLCPLVHHLSACFQDVWQYLYLSHTSVAHLSVKDCAWCSKGHASEGG